MSQAKVKPKRHTVGNRILSVGGGKGGTGKSLITACIGICLADKGNDVLLIDADLGTANLHTFLGLEPPPLSLSDFVTRKKSAITEVISKTGIHNLKLISGAKDMIGMANLTYAQKVRILNNIKSLNYEYILIDLGPGTSFNILDFFLISHCGILITSPEPTSIENTYRFVKGLLFRYLRNDVSQKVVRSLIDKGVRQRGRNTFETVFDLLEVIERLEPNLRDTIQNHLLSLDIKLIVNQVRNNRDSIIAQNLALAAKKYFGISIDFLGSVSYDTIIQEGLLQRKPLTAYYPYAKIFEELIKITEKISPQHQLGLGFSQDSPNPPMR